MKRSTKTYIRNLQENIQERYPDLDLELYEYVQYPFAIERSKFPRGRMALELADLREESRRIWTPSICMRKTI